MLTATMRNGAVGVALVAALALTACTSQPAASPEASTTPPEAEAALPTLKPLDEAGLTATFEAMAEEYGQPGAALLIRTPEGSFTATYGSTDPSGKTPVSIDDHIRIGSNTKTMTGSIILQLVQEGKIALDDPVSAYRPDVPNGDNITIEQLLLMRSGIANYSETLKFNVSLDSEPERVYDPEELLKMGLALPVDFAPGTGYHYSNTNTVLLGLIAEQLDDKPMTQIFDERIFEPLGLTETSFPEIEDASLPSPHSEGYFWWDNEHTIYSAQLPADLLADAEDGSYLPENVTLNNPSWAWTAGAGISTAEDLADWVEALVGGNDALLDPEMQQARMDSFTATSPAPGAPEYGWNLGKFGPLFYGHSGELPGFNSFMGYDPVNKVTVVVWANLAPAANGKGPAADISQQLIEDMYTSVD